MSLRTRLIALLSLITAGFLSATALLHLSERNERPQVLAAAHAAGEDATERWIHLEGVAMRQCVDDYSWWDDMVTFVDHPSPEWAETNLEEMIEFFALDGIWVFSLACNAVYAITDPNHPQVAPPSPVLPHELQPIAAHDT
ncbi:MAG: hypothetical protein J6386_09525 [Candidatus Synoicihabitans palmerolidicus]|nr:hypothetical protein [Candidatus Synoicihabitans palmerolidicus]